MRAAFPAAVILRPSIIFGPEDGFFNKFAGLARFFPALPLIGGGKTRFQPVFVGDVAAAIAGGADSEPARGRTYELGGPTIYCFKELMQIDAARNRPQARCWCRCPSASPRCKAMFLQLLPNPLLTARSGAAAAARQCGVAHRAGAGRSGHHAHFGGSGKSRPICGAIAPRANMPI